MRPASYSRFGVASRGATCKVIEAAGTIACISPGKVVPKNCFYEANRECDIVNGFFFKS
jgi:hypothetical protein